MLASHLDRSASIEAIASLNCAASANAADLSYQPLRIDDTLVIRRLVPSDYGKRFLHLLSQLTDVGQVSQARFEAHYAETMLNANHQVWVIEDTAAASIIGSATLLIELKFIHNLSRIAHVEDVVISDQYRGRRLGYRLIEHVMAVAQSLKCYKIILDCDEKNVAFYQKLGFAVNAAHLARYFKPKDQYD